MYYRIIINARVRSLGNGLTYASDTSLSIGSLVRVPLRGSFVEGIVWEQTEKPTFTAKQIDTVLSGTPMISSAMRNTAKWMAEYYLCTIRDALSVMLPSPVWSKLLPSPRTLYTLVRYEEVRGKKQQRVLDVLKNGESMDSDALRQESGASKKTIDELEKRGLIASHEEIAELQKKTFTAPDLPHYSLHPSLPTLLYYNDGRTDRTDEYARIITDCIRESKQAVLITPDILRAEELQQSLRTILPDIPSIVLHSGLTAVQQRTQWQHIRAGQLPLIIGTRSALFAPAANIGAILIDNEHDWLHKNEQTPRFHVRLTAEVYARYAKTRLILTSASPSLESWHHSSNGRFQRMEIGEKAPAVRIVNLQEVPFGTAYPLSATIIDGIQKTLEKKQQSLLYLNHRGSATIMICEECKTPITTEDGRPFSVHIDMMQKQTLRDHRTGIRKPIPEHCPQCQSVKLKALGAGTQRIEALMKQYFPDANILRIDSDSMTDAQSSKAAWKRITSGDIDIIIGTQSVLHCAHLSSVTFAAAVLADVGLSLPHIRAGEKTVQQLRALLPVGLRGGTVVLQTYRPDAPEFALLNDYEAYATQELAQRKQYNQPPYSPIVHLLAKDPQAMRNLEQRVQTITKDAIVRSSFADTRAQFIELRGITAKKTAAQLKLSAVSVEVDPLSRF